MKTIPTPSHQSYKLLLIDKIESVIKRMGWKVYFLMENKAATLEEPHKETYGFKSKHHPSQSKYLEAFEKDLFNVANPLKFRPVHNHFPQTLKEDKAQIKSSHNVFIFADKTKNYISHHQKNIKNISRKFNNRIECLAKILHLYH